MPQTGAMSKRFRLPARMRIRLGGFFLIAGIIAFVLGAVALKPAYIVLGAVVLGFSAVSVVRARAEEKAALAHAERVRRARAASTITVYESDRDKR